LLRLLLNKKIKINL